MPAAPGKQPVTFNIPTALQRKVSIEAAKRQIRKGHLITEVLEKHLDDYLKWLDDSKSTDGGHV